MSLVYNTNISKTEYLVDLENNGKAKQTALLSMSSTAPSGTFQKGSQYFNSTDKKIYTAVEDNVWGTTGKDPNFGIIYQCNNDYYVWDGDNLITTDLEGYEKLVNKAINFNTVNNTKYPTTKAVADYVVKESIVRNFTDAGITKTTSSDVFSDRTNNTGLAEEILAKQFPTGTTLYGEVRNQGMPTGIGNAEIRVEILETKSNGAQVIEFTLFSVDIEPKEWSHIYFSARTEQQNPWVWIPKAVPTDDYTSDATTTVPTSKALSDSLLLKQDISNKSDDYTESSKNKYPSSFALYKGLEGVRPNAVTNSGTNLPATTGYSLGDTFLNTTDKKLYTIISNSYVLSSNYTNTATLDLETGIASGFSKDYNYTNRIESTSVFPLQWVNNLTFNIHFKLNSIPNDDLYYVMFDTGNNTNGYGKNFGIAIKNKKLYLTFSELSQSPTYLRKENLLADYELNTNIEYYLTINKNGTSCISNLYIGGYNGELIEGNEFETEDWYSSNFQNKHTQYGMGYLYTNNNYQKGFSIGQIYLVDTTGNVVVPSGTLIWNSGESLINLTQYADTTNGIMYFYANNQLFYSHVDFADIGGIPSDNTALNTVLNSKQDNLPDQTDNNGKFLTTDGSTMSWGEINIPEGNNLYDIKLLSQAITDKGWAGLSHTTRKDIAKTSVPTLYNDILEKYNNVDTGATDFTLYTTGLNRNNYIVLDGDYYYFCWSTNQGNNLKKCLTSNLNIPGSDIDVKDGDNNSIPASGLTGFHKSDNMFVLSYDEYNKLVIKFYNKNWVLAETKEFTHEGWVDYYGCSYVKEDNNDYYWYIQLKTETGQNKRLIKIKDDLNDLTVIDITSEYAYKVWNIKRYNGYYFYGCEERNSVYKTQLAENIGSSSNVIKCVDNCAGEFTIIGNTIKTGGSNGWGKISFDKGETWQSPSGYNSGYQSQINDNLVFYSQSDNLYTTNDLVNYTLFGTVSGGGTGYVQYENDTTIYTTGGQMWYSSVIKTQYTDTYQINGNSVNINYYKNNDWKICLPNITNDTNLDTVYNFLGYLNYWRLDTTSGSETISLPRNSNLWTMMYVGDDYEDNNLPSGNYSAIALKSELPKNLSFTNVSASNWVVDNTYADYGYKCDLSCLGVTTNMFAQVIFNPTEADSGNYATICETGNGTVTIYSKVNDTITIPSIVVMGV